LKYHIRTNIGEELNLVNWWFVTQLPSLNLTNIFFYSISVVTLVAFEWFRQINILPNPLFQQIVKYYIYQYLFLYGISCIKLYCIDFLLYLFIGRHLNFPWFYLWLLPQNLYFGRIFSGINFSILTKTIPGDNFAQILFILS